MWSRTSLSPRNLLSEEVLNINFEYFNLVKIKKNKIIKPRIRARLRKNKQIINKGIDSFFNWVKGAELVSLKECDTADDPVRPELDNEFRTSYGRKIYGVKYKNEIHAIMCFAFTN